MTSKSAPSIRSRWLALALGTVATGLGLSLIVRPFASLGALVFTIAAGLVVIGLSRLTGRAAVMSSRALGALWVVIGVVLLVLPNMTVRWLVLIVGIYLIVDGLGDIWVGVRATTDERFASFVRGIATAIFGLLALTWPDITILVIAIVFAARLVILGITQVIGSLRKPREKTVEERPPGAARRWVNVIGAVASLVVAGDLAVISSAFNDGEPVVDEFYAAPGSVPDEPGALIRHERFERGIPDNALA